MPRAPRFQAPGALYHIMSRGTAKRSIFLNAGDRRLFLKILATVVRHYRWLCHAYCLQDNHYHLILETPLPNLSDGMRYLNGSYCQAFNRTYNRVGHLTQGRYTSRLIEEEQYLFTLIRYIALNPVKDGFCRHPAEWQWSSYGPTAGLAGKPAFLTTERILNLFSDNLSEAQERYVAYIGEALQEIGSRGPRNLERGQLLSKIFETASSRDEGIIQAYSIHRYKMHEIGDYLGLHESTVSKIVKRTADRSNRYPRG